MTNILKHSMPIPPSGYFPNGWMNHIDRSVLYNLALKDGNILEIGPWIGRSTVALAMGIRDRDGHSEKHCFDLVDYGITSIEEWDHLFSTKFNLNSGDGHVIRSIYTPGGSLAVLIDNLVKNNLLQQVTTITRGNFLDFRSKSTYGLIMCDTSHSYEEVKPYLEPIKLLCQDNTVLVFDDVIDIDFANYISSYFNPRMTFMTNTLDKSSKLLLIFLGSNDFFI